MKVEINNRGNGACPLCYSSQYCRIADTLARAMDPFSLADNPMELVIYSCPYFQEKSDHE